ncbi:MAG: protein prkA [Armatimonadetes bacterium JP3_11]|jgi:serine protein kinase|nr:MAG: protein prkA [Armatimonadetes bacterium CP1_7O]OYT75552.1 MAG: protein prkA [Armatimonadetes bacterium JP3_11]RMH09743.1 MAG: protein prkA [Armatimonadota bacterium]
MSMSASDFLRQIEEQRRLEKQIAWEGTFREYLEIVQQNPKVANLAHARVYDMIMSAGVEEHGDGHPREYKFFTSELFGMERTLQQLVEEYFAPAAKRLDVRKRILLLVGPVGGGKSTLVTMLKRGLERYSRTDEGAVYAIKDCPMHEEPLHLVPEELRADFKRQFGVHIEGDLCPVCQWKLRHEWGENIQDVPVVRIKFSERERIGIGTFKPSDPKSQDVSELTGSVNLNLLTQIGVESDPRVYNFDGELNKANRGIMEFIEMLKADKRFLYELNTVAGEQMIKIGRFALIYTDVVVIAHTNEYEYNAYFSNKENEAMIDRMFVVKVPYNLQVSQEVRIYEKLIQQSQWSDETQDLSKVHIAPHSLRVAAMFAVLSRLKPPKKSGMSLMTKMKLYDGERQVGDWDQRHVKELREEYPDEGLTGVSPRFILNRLSAAMVRGDKRYITPIDVLRSIRDGLTEYTNNEEERKKLLTLLDDVRKEYDEQIKKEVQRFFVYSYEEAAHTLLENYLDNVDAYCNKTKVRDPITNEEVDPDEKLMRSIEEQIGVSENAKREFREGIMRSVASLARRGVRFEIGSDERLREAIERKLFADLKDVVKITTSARTPDPEQLRKINDVIDRMVSQGGYTPESANEILRYVGALLNR